MSTGEEIATSKVYGSPYRPSCSWSQASKHSHQGRWSTHSVHPTKEGEQTSQGNSFSTKSMRSHNRPGSRHSKSAGCSLSVILTCIGVASHTSIKRTYKWDWQWLPTEIWGKWSSSSHFRSHKMSFLVKASLLFLLGAQSVYSTALDDYVWKPDSNYGWVDMVRNPKFDCKLLQSVK